jgi:hypothetical protein
MLPYEREAIEEQARLAGLSTSAYMRKRCLGKPVLARADVNLIQELRRLGGLFKHLANDGKITRSERETALKAILKTLEWVVLHDRQESQES